MGAQIKKIFLLSVFIFTASCGSQPSKEGDSNIAIDASEPVAQARSFLQQATEAQDTTEKTDLMLQAAEILAAMGDSAWARAILNKLPPRMEGSPLPPAASVRMGLINSYIAESEADTEQALKFLQDPQLLENINYTDTSLRISVLEQKAKLFNTLGQFNSAVDERLLLANLYTDEDLLNQNNDEIWRNLMEIPLKDLKALASASPYRISRGWYELATLSKDNQTNLRQQVKNLDDWVIEWPEHPASLQLPADLQLLRTLLENRPKKIAVLLPFSGKLKTAGDAIRNGLMAAFYDLKATGDETPLIQFFDSNSADINQLYDQAVGEGAELIVGPLEKDKISELALRSELPTPTLSLNSTDLPLGPVANLYQFGLGVEDESRQAAQKARQDGHHRALVITPNSLWGDRSAEAFIQTWEASGGQIVDRLQFNEGDYSTIVKKAFKVDESEERAKNLRRIVGSIEYEVRRRKDVDVILLAANPKQARQVNPTFAFYFAGDIPVYATRQVFSGKTSPKLDQDLNDIKFSVLPWVINENLNIKNEIERHADDNPALQDLYALGVDAFFLYPRLPQLESVKQASFYGNTGKLKLNEARQIQREQVWAEFKNGYVRPLHDSAN